MNSKRLSRLTIITIAFIAGGAFIALAVTNLDFSTDAVVSQLTAVVILVVVLILLAAIVAYLIRRIAHWRENRQTVAEETVAEEERETSEQRDF